MVTLARLLLAWLLLVPAARAADVRLEVETRSLAAGEALVFQVVVADGDPRGVPDVVAPAALRVSYVGQAQSMSIVNGHAQRFVQFRFELLAREPGRHVLGPAKVELRGAGGPTTVTTGTETIEVGPPRAPGRTDVPVEVAVRFDTEEAWQGEVVVLTATSRSRVELLGAGWVGLPTDGLLPPRDGTDARSEYAIRDGTGVVEVDELALPRIATTPGDLSWAAPVLQVEVPAEGGRRDLFGMVIRRTERAAIPAEAVRLLVKPRPTPPPEFSGLVGEFTLTSRLAADSARVGESVEWILDLTGDGTVEGFSVPPTPELDRARVYDTTPQAHGRVQQGAYVAGLQWRRTIVPTQEGRLEVPGLSIVYFSPSKGQYETLTAPGKTLRVRPGEAGATGLTSFGEAGEVLPPEPTGPRPAPRTGAGLRLPVEQHLPFTLGALALPGVLAAGALAQAALRERRARAATPREATVADLLAAVDAAPDRAAALDAALRLALRAGPPPDDLATELDDLSRALDQARFAGRPLPTDAEARLRAALRRMGHP